MSAVPGTREERLVEADLAAREPGIPGVPLVLDPLRLRGWAAGLGIDLPPGARVDRLRHKPSTAVRAAVDPGDGGCWWLLTVHSPDSWRKAGKDVRAGAAAGRVLVDEPRRAVLVPAAGDRALPQLRRAFHGPTVRTVAHNPARRAVLRIGGIGGEELLKVHADAVTAGRSARAARVVAATGVRTPQVVVRGVHQAATVWVPGTHWSSGDAADVADLVARLRTGDADGLPTLSPADLDGAVRRAVAGLLAVPLPAVTRRRVDLLGRRWRVWAGDPVLGVQASGSPLVPQHLAHGDLSPDQLVRCAGTGELVLLDLDRAGLAPRGWDAAGWLASTTALGWGPVALQGHDPHPLLVAAAALVRSVEPFRRRRAGWLARTSDLLTLAEGALDAVDDHEARS